MRLRQAFARARPSLVRAALAFSRTAGAMLGAFIVTNALGDLFVDHFGMDFVWISFPGWLAFPGRLLLVAAAVTLLYSSARPITDRRPYIAGQAILAALALASFANGVGFYALLARGRIASSLPFPSSFLVTAMVCAAMDRIRRERNRGALAGIPDDVRRVVVSHASCAVALAVAAPLSFALLFGATDYCPRTEPGPPAANCIVVYGARVYANGTPSLSLADRTRHGIRLWKLGAAPTLVMSGGPNESGYAEARAMLRIATAASVPPGAVLLDEEGRNTCHTVRNTAELMAERGWTRSVSVSHYFHLLRIKLVARRLGTDTLTSPCPMTRRLVKEPYFVLRECAALYWYYFTKW